MSEKLWTTVDEYVGSLYAPDPTLADIREAAAAEKLPDIAVSVEQGRFLSVLARSIEARAILEIGTLGGFSAVCLARAIPPDGRVVTLESDATHAQVARDNLVRAGVADRVTVVVGAALETLPGVQRQYPEGFDFIFIDADKEGYPDYWHWARRVAHVGTMIVADNVIRDGAVADEDNHDEQVEGVREYLKLAATDPAVLASVVQTVGPKGYDGFSISVVLPS